MNNNLVSIIMPMHNSSRYVVDSIESVLLQSYKFWELIVVDDHSEDNSVEVVEEYVKKDSRIRLLHSKNRGAAEARNYALREAKGRWIAFLDSDDLWHHQKLEKQLRFMKDNKYSFTYTNYSQIDENGKERHVLLTGPKKINKTIMYFFNFMGCLTVMYDSAVIGIIQVPNLKKRNDYAIWLKAIKESNAYLLDENLAQYRVRETGSITSSNKRKIELFKAQYYLYRISEQKNIFLSLVLVILNVLGSRVKKVMYEKRDLVEDKN